MRTYYDHEPAYQKIAASGGRGWDDLNPGVDEGSYLALEWFLETYLGPRHSRCQGALDLGCGGGQVAIRLASRGFRVSGVDFSETAIELATRNAAEADSVIDFRVGDCLTMEPFGNETFDLVVDNHVLHCLIGPNDRGAFLQSAGRVLKRGGTFFSETMSAEGPIDMAALGIDPRTRVDRHGSRYWVTLRELNQELQSAGLRVIHQELRRQADSPPPGDTIVTVATHLVA